MQKFGIIFIVVIFLVIGGLLPRSNLSVAQEMLPNFASEMAWLADGNALAVIDRYGVAVYRLDDLETEPIHFAEDLTISIAQVVLSPDGALAATLHDRDSLQNLDIEDSLRDGLGWVWNTATGERLYELDGHGELTVLTGVGFSPDGRYVAYGGVSNGTVYVKHAATGETIASLNPQENDPDWEPGLVIPPLDGLQFDPTGQFLLTHHRGQMTMWALETWDELATLTGTPNNFSNFVLADGGYAVGAVDSFGNPFAWLTRDASPLFESEIGQYEVDAVGFSEYPSAVAVRIDDELGVDQIELINLETETTQTITIEGLDLTGSRRSLSFVGDGRLLILVQDGGTLRYTVVNVDKAQMVAGFAVDAFEPHFAVDEGGNRLAIGYETSVMGLNLENGDVIVNIDLPPEGPMPPLLE